MSDCSYRIKIRREARKQLERLLEMRKSTILIHYSCEDFYNREDGSSPRITSIATRDLENAQTKTFSFHQMAEIRGVSFLDIESQYNDLEKAMLGQFYEYVAAHKKSAWLHWNMRDINYGFPALAHRFQALGGTPVEISDSNLYDLARLFTGLFGTNYINHPRLKNIIAKNKISDKDFLSGEQEANAFKAKEYIKIHQSVLRKVDSFESLLDRLASKSIKTDAKWSVIYGGMPGYIIEVIKDHWLVVLIALIVTIYEFIKLFFSLYSHRAIQP